MDRRNSFPIACGAPMHREAVAETGVELIRFARSVGLVRGEWVAIDGSKFRAVSSAQGVREREALKRYLDELESADAQEEVEIDPHAVAAALEKMAELGVDLGGERLLEAVDFFGDFAEAPRVAIRVAAAFVVGDDGEAFAEGGGELG